MSWSCRCSSLKKPGDGLGEQEEDESSKHDPEGKKEHPLEDYEVYEIFKKKIEDACKSAPDIEPSVGMICGCLFNSSWLVFIFVLIISCSFHNDSKNIVNRVLCLIDINVLFAP